MTCASVSRVAVAFALEARANSLDQSVRADLIMPHSRRLPTEVEIEQARFAARQLRACADDIRGGLSEGDD